MKDVETLSAISARHFKQIVHRFTRTFDECLDVILSIKEGTVTAEGIQTFQARLYQSLLVLSRAHFKIEKERQRLVNRKPVLSADFHAKRQKVLAHRQKVLKDSIAVGRSLGDAFLWFFYRNDPALLRRHRLQPAPSLPPAGDGGEGELVLADAVRRFGDKIVLFHGISNQFRLGDASLLDPASQRIVGIGELKTTRIDHKTLNLQFFASMDPGVTFEIASPKNDVLAPPLDDVRQARLDKQLKTISLESAASAKPPIASVELTVPTLAHVAELTALVKDVRPGLPQVRQMSPGLFVVGVSSRHRAMTRRLKDPSFDSANSVLETVRNDLAKLNLAGSPHNCLIIGDVVYGSEWRPFLVDGATPILLWPLDSEVQRSLATGEVKVLTLFNPAHMLAKFTKTGLMIVNFSHLAHCRSHWIQVDARLLLKRPTAFCNSSTHPSTRRNTQLTSQSNCCDDFERHPPMVLLGLI